MSVGSTALHGQTAMPMPEGKDYAGRIADLYRRYLEETPPDSRFYRYIHAHSRNSAAQARHIAAFMKYAPFLDGARTVLDWGCRQAIDSCLIRMYLGEGVEIHGCDIDNGDFRAFHDFARLNYRPLSHTWRLPYEDEQFDVVVGSGALEHAANDSESLKELWRILRPGGHLVVTFLPNARSWTETINEKLGNEHHRRRYTLSETRRMFMHHGFLPVKSGYHQVVPTGTAGGRIGNNRLVKGLMERAFALNPVLERTWPFYLVAANLMIVARKVQSL
ncbi:MAG TPA: class I SAM-dependent methyltransferase [Azospirillaceae bacterium]|nr:class I SAM-dependent methyltransferase [Azospirillaceae bacterium]